MVCAEPVIPLSVAGLRMRTNPEDGCIAVQTSVCWPRYTYRQILASRQPRCQPTMFTAAQDLLLAYGRLAGLPTLGFDEHGCARLVFEGDVAVDLEADEPAHCIQVYAVLGPVPPGNREPLYRRLLEGNLFGQQTGGAMLAVDPVREEVLLCGRVDPAVVSAEALSGWMDGFAGTAAHWLRRYAAGELTAVPGLGQEPTLSSHWQGHFVPG
jgi:hypothetical protein